jgi:MoaA/NifB/PqqE/SkfB family radical SAM enzyme
MLQGKQNPLCSNCYKYQELGRVSERVLYNRYYQHYFSRVKDTNADGSLTDINVPLIDIRFSNKCNYKCRICSSEYSTLWYDEEQKLGKVLYDGHTKEMKPTTDDEAFWESYKKMLSNVKRLHFAGGEPLFMDEHYASLQHLIDTGNTDVVLSYNTNFSTLRYKKYNVIELWKKFKQVEIWASLDGMFQKGDYQRKGQKWEKIEENIRGVQQQCPNVLFGVNVTVSIFNILDIPAFYQYMVDNKLVRPDRMNLYILFSPHQFNIINLTPALKAKALQQFQDFENNYLNTLPDTTNIRDHVKAIIKAMTSEQGARINEFRESINEVDALRDENFISVYPELGEMMHEKL